MLTFLRSKILLEKKLEILTLGDLKKQIIKIQDLEDEISVTMHY